MIKHWDALIKHLNIQEKPLTEETVNKIVQWCRENISQEIELPSDWSEAFPVIKRYANQYFEKLIKFSSEDLLQARTELNGLNCIQYASLQGYDIWLQQLFKTQPSPQTLVNDTAPGKLTPLHFACLTGHLQTVNTLIANGASLNAKTNLQLTPLMLSLSLLPQASDFSKKQKERIFRILKAIMPGAELIKKDSTGNNIVHLMAKNGFDRLLREFLLEYPALGREKNFLHRTALHEALLAKQSNAVEILVSIKGILQEEDSDQKLPLHYAASYASKKIVELCFNDAIDIDSKDVFLRTALHFAALRGDLEIVQFLIQNGASVESTDQRGFTVLHYAIESQNLDLIRWLYENTTVDLNAQDFRGKTALVHLITEFPMINTNTGNIINYLLAKGCDLELEDKNNHSARDYLQILLNEGHLPDQIHLKKMISSDPYQHRNSLK